MEKFSIDLSNALSNEHQVIFLGDSVFKKYLNTNVIFVELDIKRSRNNIVFLYKLFKIFQDFSPDIIHVHKQKSFQIMKRLEAFVDTPFVITKHDTQIKKAFYGLKYAISISQKTMENIKAKYIFKIYNGIPYVKPKKIEMPNAFKIVAVGGLRKVKGYDRLILAVANLPFDFHLTIIGEGSERKYLEELIIELGLEKMISLVGFKSNVNDYFYSSDLQIISSKSEGFSLTMIEGIFYSKVLISTKVSGCTEILSDDLLYDIENLTEKINDVYENQERYKQAFNKVKKRYKEHLTINTCMKNHVDVYEKIIEQRNGKT
ncbi:MAG: glycosyltransferase [Bacteroidota bacterium]